MTIVPKILLFMILSVTLVIGGVSFLNIRQTQEVVYSQIDRLLTTNLEFAKAEILEIAEGIKQTTEIVARHPEISKSLFLQLSRGINKILNEMVLIYPFFNYVMIVEPNGDIFAASTRDSQGNKIAGEQLLGLNFKKNSLYAEPSPKETITGIPGSDPYLTLIELKRGMSQWFIAPVLKRGELIGWVVISYDWQDELSALLANIARQLKAVGNPTIEVILTDENGNIVVGTKPGEEKFIPSADKLWKEKELTFGRTTMKMVISNDRGKTNQPVAKTKRFLLFITISSTLLLIVILYFILQKTLLHRLSALHLGTTELGKGNLAHRLPALGRDEIGDLAKTFNHMAQFLEKAQKELVTKGIEAGRAQLSAMVLHNIGNALTPMKVQTEVLGKDELAQTVQYLEKCYQDLNAHMEDLKHYVNKDPRGKEVFNYLGQLIVSLNEQRIRNKNIFDKIDGGLTYVSEILSLQQTYSASEQEIKEKIDLNSLLEDALRMQLGELEKRKISVKWKPYKNVPKLLIDKNRLMQVANNLIKNSYEGLDALNHNKEETFIAFKTFADQNQVGFEISDNGIGIEPGQIDHIFEFGKSFKGSSGVGLYYCRMFVEANRGELSITSPGKEKGTTVRITFDHDKETSEVQAKNEL
ncbi:MAG: HAMP domain-containing histidine kinase [bacterium]|nr:HAMP domain-containing histidine kinase [bacterium]